MSIQALGAVLKSTHLQGYVWKRDQLWDFQIHGMGRTFGYGRKRDKNLSHSGALRDLILKMEELEAEIRYERKIDRELNVCTTCGLSRIVCPGNHWDS